jgi:hypothetical protein
MIGRRKRAAAAVVVAVAGATATATATAPPQRWRHGQEEAAPVAPRMPTSVASGVQNLRETKAAIDPFGEQQYLINDAEVEAARRFYEDYVHGIEGVREPSLAQRSGSADAHDVAIARAMAVGRHRDIAELLGTRMTGWLIAFLVEDLTFVAMAERYWPGEEGRKQMKGAMATMLLLLSRLYAALDRGGRRQGRSGRSSGPLIAGPATPPDRLHR